MGQPGTAGLVEPVERRLHHIGQGDQPLITGIQAEKQGAWLAVGRWLSAVDDMNWTLSC